MPHNDVFKLTWRTSSDYSKHISTISWCDNQPLELCEPSTLTSVCGISSDKSVPGKTSICPFL